ncbi:MAG: hypothetical protein WC577_00025 [Candidatus Paceibacterota bacterium]
MSSEKIENLNTSSIGESKNAECCPYCKSKNFVKRGTRQNQYQVVQLYLDGEICVFLINYI